MENSHQRRRSGSSPRHAHGVVRIAGASWCASTVFDVWGRSYSQSGGTFLTWRCKPKAQKIPSRQIKPCHDRIQVDDLSVATEGLVPIQMDMAPRRRRNLLDQNQGFFILARFVLGPVPTQLPQVRQNRFVISFLNGQSATPNENRRGKDFSESRFPATVFSGKRIPSRNARENANPFRPEENPSLTPRQT